jgi:hypothetical protein
MSCTIERPCGVYMCHRARLDIPPCAGHFELLLLVGPQVGGQAAHCTVQTYFIKKSCE